MKTDTATKINNLHAAFCKAIRKPVEIAIQLGELLTEQKKIHQHGTWESWIRANLKFNERSAQVYMRTFRNWGGKTLPPNLTIEDASKVFSKAQEPALLPPLKHKPNPSLRVVDGLNVVEDPSHTIPNKTTRRELPDIWKFMDELRSSINEIFGLHTSRRQKLEDLIRDRGFIHDRHPGLKLLIEALRLLAEEATEFADKLESPPSPEPTPVSPEVKLLTAE